MKEKIFKYLFSPPYFVRWTKCESASIFITVLFGGRGGGGAEIEKTLLFSRPF